MASTYSTLKIELIGTGEKSGTWGVTTNVNLGTAIEEAITGSADVTFASGTVTLTLTDVNTTQAARNLRLRLTGTSGGAQDLIVPAIEKMYLIKNDCADTITVKNSTGTGVAVLAGTSVFVYNDGTNVTAANTAATTTNANLTGPITSVGNATSIASQTGTGTTFAMSASPTFTGTVTIPTPFTLGAVPVLPTGTELNFVDGVTSNIQTQLDAKSPLASPTFTGTVSIPTPFNLGGVSVLPTGTELNFVDGVTSSIQTQFTNAASATALKSNTASPTFTGTVTLPTLVGSDTTDASSSTTGAFKTAGGLGVAKKLYVGTDLAVAGTSTLTGDITKSKSAAGTDSFITLENTSTAASSNANLLVKVAGTAAGDPSTSYTVTSGESWTTGIDNSDSDKYKISNSLLLGFNDCLVIPTSGAVELPLGLTFTGPIATSTQGSIWKGVTNGFTFRSITGAVNDFALIDAVGNATNLLQVPTGTSTLQFPVGLSVTGGSTAVGSIFKGGTNGLTIRGVTGSSNDFSVIDAANAVGLINNPTGTAHINMGGSFGRGSPVVKTADFTVGVSENWLANIKAGSACTVTLPNASAYPGREITITNYINQAVNSASANIVSQTGIASTTAILAGTAGKWATLVAGDGSWRIMQSN